MVLDTSSSYFYECFNIAIALEIIDRLSYNHSLLGPGQRLFWHGWIVGKRYKKRDMQILKVSEEYDKVPLLLV